MKSHKDILEDEINKLHEVDQPYLYDGIYDGKSSSIFKAIELAAKQAFEYGRLLINNPNYNIEPEFSDIFEIRKYNEFEDYLKDLKNE